MKLVELSLQNFLSYGKKQTINLDNRGIVLISADNGSGKSGLLAAIVFAIYGESLRDLPSIDDVINKKIGKDCEVSLTLEDNGITYKITRTRGNSGAKKANDLKLFINNKDSSAGTNTDTQELVDNIIGMDYYTFTQAVLLSSGEKSFCRMTDSQQKELLEDILQITVFANAHKETKLRISAHKLELANLKTNLDKNNDLLIERKRQLSLAEEQQTLQETNYNNILLRYKQKKNALEIEIEEIIAKDENLVDLHKKEHSIKLLMNFFVNTIDGLQKEWDRNKKFDYERIAQIDAKLAVNSHVKSDITAKRNKLQKLGNTVCGSCEQPVDSKHIDKHLGEYDLILLGNHQQYQELVDQKKSIQDNFKEYEEVYAPRILTEQTNLDLKEDEYNTVRLRISNREHDFGMLKVLDRQIREVKESIQDHLKTKNLDNSRLIKDLENSILKISKELLEIINKITYLNEQLDLLGFWERAFSNKGIKNYLLDAAIPYLNSRVKYYSDLLSNNTLNISFATQSHTLKGEVIDKLAVNVVSSEGTTNYAQNSAGERRRADIAIAWALGDLAYNKSNKFIQFKGLDEIFDNLDLYGEEAVIKLLNNEIAKYGTIFIISHNQHLKNQFDNVIEIIKQNGFSNIKE